jgi:hypothetical protein
MGAIKVKEINLEQGSPTVEQAMGRLVNGLSTAKGAGFRSVILIHGYGSSGIGGAIKVGVLGKLKEPMLKGMIRDFVAGEKWNEHKKTYLEQCPQLKEYEDRIRGNPGVTVVILKG